MSDDLNGAQRDYAALVERGLDLDLTRGKPSAEQLDLSNGLLALPGPDDYTAADGTDCRNYGGTDGLPELREIFSELLQVPVKQLLAGGNASLQLMHDTIVHCLLGVLPGAERRWADERIAFLAPVPGYDRHFALSERYGIELIPVPMTDQGPDMDVVERYAAEDPKIKGIWCVPKYSNPDGVTYSDETARRLAAMNTAAGDFRIFWDNAYTVHHLTDDLVEVADILTLCAEAGNPDRAFVFGSTSKITMAGAGVAFFGSSPANVDWFKKYAAKATIGPDKINQLRHVRFLKDADGVRALMAKHAELIRPKFEAVNRILTEQLGGTGLATWSDPKGGYFICLQVPKNCAKAVVKRAAEAGIKLTPAGATHPYGDDPDDRTIRIAPTYPSLAELEQAIHGLTVCVRLAGYESAVS